MRALLSPPAEEFVRYFAKKACPSVATQKVSCTERTLQLVLSVFYITVSEGHILYVIKNANVQLYFALNFKGVIPVLFLNNVLKDCG